MLRCHHLLFLGLVVSGTQLCAQDNYEIQVYGADTVERRSTMVELHSNFTVQGSTAVVNRVLPTNHALHETVEITHGWNDWFETGFYIFTSGRSGDGWDWVGDHIRPRFRVPGNWHWPVGLGLSTEIGYQQRRFAEDTWTWEIRPIIDKKAGRWYLSFNPTIDKSIHGLNAGKGWEFSPNAKVSFDITKVIGLGVEYYGSLGPFGNPDPLSEQQQQIFSCVDLNIAPQWEVNFGVGWGLTSSTDHLIVKTILGRRFSWRKEKLR